ncbi:sugar ABC transporter ATP-binding protein [Trinickia caryophylli]|nr:sugar ABC transporter ATP-binding protein [Trinickia caryophylli]PMS12832.1 D-xylose ABC transporter ATP-binding protein [Trinickia caryophylli]TRX15463.1 sugar ABC transporter ATP-binding protein [Trinickia caryophylli]WQE15649.1 sugar ABC transporter ATP-binding protein [Trinickia caryophylli]
MHSGMEPLLAARNVRKAFPGVVALDNVSIEIHAGRVHALMGENGAGKSTMMKIIAGIYTPDGGTLRFKGEPIKLKSPRHALDSGIAMIHQELNLLPDMTVAENIWIRREPRYVFGLVDHKALNRRTEALFAQLGIHIDPEAQLGSLSIANRQMVEIAKAVSFDSDLLIMDEPTSAITDREVEQLFRIIGELKARGKAIVYITHKMDEVFEIADDISIFRDGHHIVSRPASEFDKQSLIAAMVGRELTQVFPKEQVPIGEVALAVTNLGRRSAFSNVSFDVRYGEILGFAGLMGSGRTEVMEAIFGALPADRGEIAFDGKPKRIRTPREAIESGLAFLTEDRKGSGMFPQLSVGENMEISAMRRYCMLGFVRQQRIDGECARMCGSLKVKTPGLGETIENLSGGNQQKVLLARWLLNQPRILILDEPTRGVDVGAKAEIHALITQLARKGAAIIMISSELPEVIGMSDRIVVMHGRTVSGILPRERATQESIMALASGERL